MIIVRASVKRTGLYQWFGTISLSALWKQSLTLIKKKKKKERTKRRKKEIQTDSLKVLTFIHAYVLSYMVAYAI